MFGLRSVTDPSPSPTPSPCGSDRPPLGWSSNNSSSSTATSATIGPPVAEKPRWHHSRRPPGHFIPLDITGTIKLHVVVTAGTTGLIIEDASQSLKAAVAVRLIYARVIYSPPNWLARWKSLCEGKTLIGGEREKVMICSRFLIFDALCWDPPGCHHCNGHNAALDSEPCGHRALNITLFLPEKSSDRESYNISWSSWIICLLSHELVTEFVVTGNAARLSFCSDSSLEQLDSLVDRRWSKSVVFGWSVHMVLDWSIFKGSLPPYFQILQVNPSEKWINTICCRFVQGAAARCSGGLTSNTKWKQQTKAVGSVDTLKTDTYFLYLWHNGFIAGREKCWSHCFCNT